MVQVYPGERRVKRGDDVTSGTGVPDRAGRVRYRGSSMGLFKKRATDPDEMARLRSQIESMAGRLEAADEEKRRIGAQVDQLAGEVAAQRDRTGDPVAPPAAAPEVSAADLDVLRARIQRIADEVARREDAAPESVAPDAFDALREQVVDLLNRFDAPLSEPPAVPPPSPIEVPPSVVPPAPDDTPVAGLDRRFDRLAERVDAMEARMVSISTELANQLSELSSELDKLDGDELQAAASALGELRDAQTHLAAEQARYQIAFREDLAELADRLGRR